MNEETRVVVDQVKDLCEWFSSNPEKLDSVKNGRQRAVALQNEVLEVVEDGAFTGEWLREKRNQMLSLKKNAERCATIEKAGRELVKEGGSLD